MRKYRLASSLLYFVTLQGRKIKFKSKLLFRNADQIFRPTSQASVLGWQCACQYDSEHIYLGTLAKATISGITSLKSRHVLCVTNTTSL
jgi:hypothetical protein